MDSLLSWKLVLRLRLWDAQVESLKAGTQPAWVRLVPLGRDREGRSFWKLQGAPLLAGWMSRVPRWVLLL